MKPDSNKPSKKIQTEELRTYKMEYCCTNCGFLYYKEFKFGQGAVRGGCANCGCDEEPRLGKWEVMYEN